MSKWAAAFVFCAIVALAPVSSNAFTLMGWGTASCADWTAARKEDNADYHEQWVLGFLSEWAPQQRAAIRYTTSMLQVSGHGWTNTAQAIRFMPSALQPRLSPGNILKAMLPAAGSYGDVRSNSAAMRVKVVADERFRGI